MSHLTNSSAPSQSQHNDPLAQDLLDENSGLTVVQELKLLREENSTLRAKADELDQLLTLALQDSEDRWTERQREYERLIEEKSEVIRTLYQKNAELRERAIQSEAAIADVPEGKLQERQELIKLQRELEQQRRQLHDDEEVMIAQLRDMELALAKDRAELARQGADIQRLQSDVKHELETAQRDKGLRERLTSLQRPSSIARKDVSQPTPLPGNLAKSPTGNSNSITKSGLFRRIFGAGQ